MFKKKLIIIVSHPIQYFVPLYQEIAINGLFDLNVFFLTKETINGGIDKHFGISITWDIPLLQGYEYKFFSNNSWNPSMNKGFWGLINLGLIFELFKAPKSIVIISGWSNFSYILSFVIARIAGHTVGIRCEAPFYKEVRNKSLKNRIRAFLLRNLLFKYFIDNFYYIGLENRQFYEFYNVPKSKLHFTPYSVDNNKFQEINKQANKNYTKNKLQIEVDKFIVLFTGKLYEVKRPFDLIYAFLKIKAVNANLIIVGEGKMKKEIEEFILKNGIKNIVLTGFINQSEIPEYYIAADCLVLCSESETWGLSINEAMNFGLPIIAYDSVGCVKDLIINNQNGFIVSKGDIMQLTYAIDRTISDIQFRKNASLKSIEIINNYSYKKVIEGIQKSSHVREQII